MDTQPACNNHDLRAAELAKYRAALERLRRNEATGAPFASWQARSGWHGRLAERRLFL